MVKMFYMTGHTLWMCVRRCMCALHLMSRDYKEAEIAFAPICLPVKMKLTFGNSLKVTNDINVKIVQNK